MTTPRRGFTLMELLLVAVIVGILATLGLVNWSKARQQALDNEAKANLHVLDLKAREYQVDDPQRHYPDGLDDVSTHGMPPVPPPDDRVSAWTYCYGAGGAAYSQPRAVLKSGRPGFPRTFVIRDPGGTPVEGDSTTTCP